MRRVIKAVGVLLGIGVALFAIAMDAAFRADRKAENELRVC